MHGEPLRPTTGERSGRQWSRGSIADTNYMLTALHCLRQWKMETNVKGYNSKFKFKYIIRSWKIRASFSIPNNIASLTVTPVHVAAKFKPTACYQQWICSAGVVQSVWLFSEFL